MAHCAPGAPRPKAAILIFSISASCSRLALARRFWNQIFTCVSVRRSDDENSARSAMLRYCFSRNFFSSDSSCCVVKGVRGLRFGLCLRRLHLMRGGSLASATEREREREMERVLISLMLSKRRWLLRCLRCWLAACLEARGQLKATKSATFAYNWSAQRDAVKCPQTGVFSFPSVHLPLPVLCTVLGLAVAKGSQRQPATSAANGNYSFKWPINLLSKLFVRQSCSRSRRREMQCPHVLPPLPRFYCCDCASIRSSDRKTILIWAFCFGKQRTSSSSSSSKKRACLIKRTCNGRQHAAAGCPIVRLWHSLGVLLMKVMSLPQRCKWYFKDASSGQPLYTL